VAARRRIAELEAEVEIHRRTAELLKEVAARKGRYEAIAVMASHRLPIQMACRVLGAAESGYYEWRGCSPSIRDLRHVWLTEAIRKVHVANTDPGRRPARHPLATPPRGGRREHAHGRTGAAGAPATCRRQGCRAVRRGITEMSEAPGRRAVD
jgi:hypothetical protein